MSQPTANRRRLVRTQGGQKAVYREAVNSNASAAVYAYPNGEESAQAHTDMPSVRLLVTPLGDWKVTVTAGLDPARVRPKPVTVAVGNVDRFPAVVPADGPNSTRLAWVFDGEAHAGTVDELAAWAVLCSLGVSDEPLPAVVYAPTTTGALAPVPVRVDCSPYDEHDWATLTVTVTLAPGVTAVGTGRVDGRA